MRFADGSIEYWCWFVWFMISCPTKKLAANKDTRIDWAVLFQKKKSNFSWKIYLILLTSYKWLDLDSLKKCIYEFFDDYNIFFKKFRWQAHQSISSGSPSILKRVKHKLSKWKYPISCFFNKGPLIKDVSIQMKGFLIQLKNNIFPNCVLAYRKHSHFPKLKVLLPSRSTSIRIIRI